ncbi:hypothetical protein P6166_00150 [Stenotrophomonas sp. HITSZ_GD]|uniref:hypothetical protein n=1 Tax=Stenotrophomonas sp. HITSZ_GD TaxID=3037248 RepID=UPI00240D070D|nr:hypothetical protein [Stenotrophomonas sp. HITSZ_GD]MDG2523772.1 hypothetical protein [Stenotrophomonas sp. HITSZ_GD]
MGLEAFLREYRGLLALLSVLATVNVMFAHRALLRLAQTQPQLLAAVGIRRIDWWPRCVLGVGRLGFTAAGRGLPLRPRVQFQAVAVTYVVLLALFAQGAVQIAGLLLR